MDEPEVKDFASAEPIVVMPPGWKPRPCMVCRGPLGARERKVHRGDCAHKREIELQRDRRRRRRIARVGVEE